jgi:hypothetical protein
MPRLSENQRNQTIGMLHAGALVINFALCCSRQTIHNLANRFANTGSVNDRPKSGRERVTSRRDDRAITWAHLRDRFNPATLTARRRIFFKDHSTPFKAVKHRNFFKDHSTPFKAVKQSSPCQETLHWADFNGMSQGRSVGMVKASSALEAKPVE